MHHHFRKELLISFGIIAGSVVFIGLSVFFLSRDIAYQSEKITEDRVAVAQRTVSLGALASLKKDAPRAAAYKQAISQVLVTKDQLLDFPKWLDGIARGRQLSLSFSFSGSESPPQENSPGHIPFSMDVSGELDDLNDFLKDIEYKSPKFLVTMDGFDTSGGGSSYRIRTSGRVYFR